MRCLVVSFLGLLSLTYTAEAQACSCMKLSPQEGLSSSHAVFSGEVIDIEKNESTRFGGLEVTVRVKDVWKGEVDEEVKVHTAGSSAACGYSFAEGTMYLIYATSDEADPFRVSLCSRTAPLDDAKEDLDFLGKPIKRFNDASSNRKSKHGEANMKDNCSASSLGEGEPGLAWLGVLVFGAVLTIRRVV